MAGHKSPSRIAALTAEVRELTALVPRGVIRGLFRPAGQARADADDGRVKVSIPLQNPTTKQRLTVSVTEKDLKWSRGSGPRGEKEFEPDEAYIEYLNPAKHAQLYKRYDKADTSSLKWYWEYDETTVPGAKVLLYRLGLKETESLSDEEYLVKEMGYDEDEASERAEQYTVHETLVTKDYLVVLSSGTGKFVKTILLNEDETSGSYD